MKEKLTLESMKLFLKTKLGIFTATAITAVVVATGVIIVLNLKEDDFRSISVFEISGSATVTRGEEQLDAYQGMLLTSSDEVTVGSDGYLRLLLDEDKYITLEPNTHIRLFATGSSADSNTKIELTQGAITNELQNKLNSNSSYEVTTPASTMAVRGTVFRVAITQDETGAYQVDLAVFEGAVGTTLIMPDGSTQESETLITAGTQAQISSDEVITQFIYTDQSIEYTSFPPSVLEYLIELKEDDRLTELPITIEELKEILNTMLSPKEESEVSTADLEEKEPETEPASETSPESETPKKSPKEPAPSVSLETSEATVTPSQEAKPAPSQAPAQSSASSASSGSGSNSSSSSSSTPAPTPSDPAVTTHTVTFLAKYRIPFATQSVVDGNNAKAPLLSPSESFDWYKDSDCTILYTFEEPITEDITLYNRGR